MDIAVLRRWFVKFLMMVSVMTCSRDCQASSPSKDLIQLAERQFTNDITDSERAFINATANGTFFFGQTNGKTFDLLSGAPAGRQTVLRADRIAWLCTDMAASYAITKNGVQVAGVRIKGDLDLFSCKIQFPLTFTNCVFDGDINFWRSHFLNVNLSSSCVDNLTADQATFEGNVDLANGFLAKGLVRLNASDIAGALYCV